MDVLGALQWPASVATLLGSWLIASTRPGRRNAGFWVFLVSNALWVVWGWHAHAPALVALQLGLAAMNVRGAVKTEDTNAASPR
jgi:hypothetical protein